MALYATARYVGDGITKEFTFNFPYINPEDLKVFLNLLPVTTGWELEPAQSKVVFTTAPATGVKVDIRRISGLTQRPVEYQAGSLYMAPDIDLDSRFVFFNQQEANDLIQTEYSFPGQALIQTEDFKNAAGVYATEARASEDAALVSKNAAAISEANAKASEDASELSETASKASEVAAKASEDASKASEDASKASEVAAKASELASKASENASKTSETNAAGSAATAMNKAEAAAQSQAAAAASAAAAHDAQVEAKIARDQAAQTLADSDLANRIGTSGPAAGRNLADNADFQIWTRGDSVAIIDGYSRTCVDRYAMANLCGTGASATTNKSTMLIDGINRTCGQFSMSAAISSYASNKYIVPFSQLFEGRSIYRYLSTGKSFTISIATKVSVAGKYAFAVRNADTSFSYVHTAVLAADTPTIVQFTVPIPTTAGVWNCPNTVAAGLSLLIGSIGGTQYATSSTDKWVAGNYFYTPDCVNWAETEYATIKVTRVRLEEGTVLGSYQAKTYEEDETRCQYFLPRFASGGFIGSGYFGNTTSGIIAMPFKVPPRVAPSGIAAPSAGCFSLASSRDPQAISSIIYNASTSLSHGIVVVNGSGYTAGSPCMLGMASGNGNLIFTGAEL